MNLHLNPFEKANLKKEEKERLEKEKELEEYKLKKMLDKLTNIKNKKDIEECIDKSKIDLTNHINKKIKKMELEKKDVRNQLETYNDSSDTELKERLIDESLEIQRNLLIELKNIQKQKSKKIIREMINIINKINSDCTINDYFNEEENKMSFDEKKFRESFLKNEKEKSSFDFLDSESKTNSNKTKILESLTREWQRKLADAIGTSAGSKFKYRKNECDHDYHSLQEKVDKLLAEKEDGNFNYDKEAFGIKDIDEIDFNTDSYLEKTIQDKDIIGESNDVIDFFQIDESDLSFALNLIKGKDSNKTKLTTRDELLRILKSNSSKQQNIGIVGNKQYLSEAYVDIKRQLFGSFFIHLNLRKMYMYNSPILFLMKHFISQLPEISIDDKKILWKRCSNLLSATKFSSTKFSEELIFDRELAITDPITNIKREINKVLNAYDLNQYRFIIIVDDIRGIDDEQFLNCISFLTIIFENITNFRLIFELDSSFIKINIKSAKLKLGLSMIDNYLVQTKVLISSYNNDSNYTIEKTTEFKDYYKPKPIKRNSLYESDDMERSIPSERELRDNLKKNKKRFTLNDQEVYNNKQDNYIEDKYEDNEIGKVFISQIFEEAITDDDQTSNKFSYTREIKDDGHNCFEDEDERKQIAVEKNNKCRVENKKLSDLKKPRLRSIEKGEEYEYKHSPKFDDKDEELLNNPREIRMKRGMEIKPIRTGDADKYDYSSETLEFSKIDKSEPVKPKHERRFGRIFIEDENFSDQNDEETTIVYDYDDDNGFSRRKYISKYEKQIEDLDEKEIKEIVNKTGEIDFEGKISPIDIKTNLARKRNEQLKYENKLIGRESKHKKKSIEDEYTKFVRKSKRRG